jgi:glycopeptide antibiotics resistance protein
MRLILNVLMDIFSFFQTLIRSLSRELGLNLGDKELHFYVIGILFFIMYLFIHPLFKAISKLSIKLISFIYVLTVTIVVAVAIEIAQFQSGTGVMDLMDVIWSVFGFVLIWGVGECVVFIFKSIRKWMQSRQVE